MVDFKRKYAEMKEKKVCDKWKNLRDGVIIIVVVLISVFLVTRWSYIQDEKQRAFCHSEYKNSCEEYKCIMQTYKCSGRCFPLKEYGIYRKKYFECVGHPELERV